VIPSSKQYGFTLLEVLLSGFILFLVLTSMTLVYRGAILSSSKATEAVSIATVVPAIRIIVSDKIRNEGRYEDHSGKGSYGGLKYDWSATLLYRGEPSILLQEDNGKSISYYLWNVRLNLEDQGMTRSYKFSELSW